MIYLIETTYYNKETKEVLDLLKIGYTEDSKKARRFVNYKLHNPGFKILYEIPGYTEDIEKRIQYKFRSYKYPDYGNEWFMYSESIVEFFRDIDSIDLSALPKNPVRGNREFKLIKKECRKILQYFLDPKSIEDYLKKAITRVGDKLSTDSLLDYLKSDPGIGISGVERYLRYREARDTGTFCVDPVVNQEVTDFLRAYDFLTTNHDKLKCLCKYGLSSESINIVLGQIPDSDEIKSYYLALGPSRLRAASYNITKIRKSLGIVVFDEDLLRNSIYSEFKEGDRLSLVNIKDRLSTLYSSISYNKKPKATDLLRFFEIKEIYLVMIVNDTKKRVRGYKLLKKKL